ncbi:hypothetical protein PPL_04804 [Heterostelium album PN500]|uniref:R3H-associated N-terminal domain-containing protein n=1 Tax=Heterostelium pallidum (strain ATCC 26659 / Pp 5 / PN500) TaxID=670386 RepID=D3B8L1_HETP5|nr:hypothetical protein PPL_04804 [Heterostelium album PN500]EFA82379.1 hypothetical protein PPL_04804 [Heterostelium album PN500]|eukprot:XP_020434496.1 hypothetical protein PPL_04804 [Heterostelium album PN500]
MAEKKISEILWERLIITEQNIASNNGAPTSGVKSKYPKKKKFRSNRDSLAFRESPGKPGTKRYNRYMNTKFLKDGGILKDRFEAEMDHNIYERNEKLIYQDREMKYEWEPYRDISYDVQVEMLKDCLPSEKDRKGKRFRENPKTLPINQSFTMLQKNIRDAFKKPFIQHSSFIATAEDQMIQFISNPYIQTTEVELESSHHRLLLHGIGSYYSVLTKRVTVRKCSILIFYVEIVILLLVCEIKGELLEIPKLQRLSRSLKALRADSEDKNDLLYNVLKIDRNTGLTVSTTQLTINIFNKLGTWLGGVSNSPLVQDFVSNLGDSLGALFTQWLQKAVGNSRYLHITKIAQTELMIEDLTQIMNHEFDRYINYLDAYIYEQTH